MDLNPVLVWEDHHVVLDAKILPPGETPVAPEVSGAVRMSAIWRSSSNPDRLPSLVPRPRPSKVGGAVLESLGRQGYPGRRFPINPAGAR